MSHRLMATVVRANARYFVKQGWEKPEVLDRLDHWLSGGKDNELSRKIESWFQRDAQWINETLPGIAYHFWYVAPVVWLVAWRTRSFTLRWAKEIANGRHSNPG